jgi:hypothetical protein
MTEKKAMTPEATAGITLVGDIKGSGAELPAFRSQSKKLVFPAAPSGPNEK